MGIHEKLMNIQSKLKAPKNQYNAFGKYKYRSCEDILEGVKPLLSETKTTLTISDEVVNVGSRFYIKATATLVDVEDGQSFSVSAFAREDESKKGMDLSQVTGSTSSYARKYALNGLFCIDDTKDSDSTNTHGESENKSDKAISKAQAKRMFVLANGNADICKTVIEKYGYSKSEEVKVSDYEKICTDIEKATKALMEGTPF